MSPIQSISFPTFLRRIASSSLLPLLLATASHAFSSGLPGSLAFTDQESFDQWRATFPGPWVVEDFERFHNEPPPEVPDAGGITDLGSFLLETDVVHRDVGSEGGAMVVISGERVYLLVDAELDTYGPTIIDAIFPGPINAIGVLYGYCDLEPCPPFTGGELTPSNRFDLWGWQGCEHRDCYIDALYWHPTPIPEPGTGLLLALGLGLC